MSAQETLNWAELKINSRVVLRNRLGELARAEAEICEEMAALRMRLIELASKGAGIRKETNTVLGKIVTVTDELRYCDVDTGSIESPPLPTGAAVSDPPAGLQTVILQVVE